MNRAQFAAASLCVIAVVSLPAQAPGTKQASPKAGSRWDLLRQAHAGLASVPDMLKPSLLVDLAAAEEKLPPAEAKVQVQSDLAAAFQAALDMPGADRDDDSPEAQLRARIKSSSEQNAIYAAAQSDAAQALAMAERADVGQLEDFNLLLNGAAQGPTHDQRPIPANVAEIIEACRAATGSLPYEGLQWIVLNSHFPHDQRSLLVHEAFRSSQNETDPQTLISAAHFLVFAYDRLPGLGPALAAAAPAVLRSIDDATHKLGPGRLQDRIYRTRLTTAAVHLLSALAAVDPQAANDIRPGFPQFAATSPRTATEAASLMTAFSMQSAKAQAQLAPPRSGASDTEKFEYYRAMAVVNWQKHPGRALEDAHKAASLVNDGLLRKRDVMDGAMRLAQTLTRLGDMATADALLNRCLDFAQKQAVQDDTSFEAASGAERVAILKRLYDYTGPGGVGYLFQLAAQADRPLAVKRAQAWLASQSRSAVLIAVASAP